MSNERRRAQGLGRRTFWRYTLLQVPGWMLALAAFACLYRWAGLPAWIAVVLLLLWLAKDVALYPWLRAAYEVDTRTPVERLVGERGVTTQSLAPVGYIRLRGELWRAEAADRDRGISAGITVEIVGADGFTFVVKEAPSGPESRTGLTNQAYI